jgi:methoxymalonate biosynthesis acyl carrier protein
VASEAVTDGVRRLFVQTLNLHVPSDDTDLIDGGLLDSLALVELLFAIEREFDIRIQLDELDIESFRTIESIQQFVQRSLPAEA